MTTHTNLLTRIYHLKLIIVGLFLVVAGVGTSLLADWLDSTGNASHLLVAILRALSDVLLISGAIGIAVDFFTGRDKEAADTERTRSVQKELIPDYIDGVLHAFAANPEHLKRVATPEFLDTLATNALSLRLGDDQFAREIYTDVRDQAIRAPERWYDVDVSIRLSAIAERDTVGVPRFDVLVKWEYSVVPSHSVQKFACFSDRDELRDFMEESPSAVPWFMTPRPGFDAKDQDAFELLEFRVDGKKRPIPRSVRKAGQVYTARIGDDAVSEAKAVRIMYLYRVITPRSGHRLFFEITQPTRDLSLTLDYTDTNIAHMSVTDLVTSSVPARVTEMPEQADAKEVSVDLPGWLLPRAGFAFVWTLASELPSTNESDAADEPTPTSVTT